MSGAFDEMPTADAQALRERAGDWLERKDRPDWSAQDQAELDAWLEDPAHLIAYWRIEAAWERSLRLRVMRPSVSGPSRMPRLKSESWLKRIAVPFAAVAVAGIAAVFVLDRPSERVIATGIGEHKIVSLGDGSRVELNTDTVLKVEVSPDRRVASIQKGEAYFQIAHDPEHPFVVSAGDHRITVLGTKFTVYREAGKLEVALLEGRIWLDEKANEHGGHGMLLTPGDKVVSEGAKLVKLEEPPGVLQNELGWRNGMLIFKYVTLADAAAEFNRYNREKLVVADAAAKLKIIGSFPTNDVNMFVRASKQLFGLRAEHRGNQIVLSH
jgi:transmembrane sensor